MIAACRRVVALAELYCGAVEVGVGLIPGAGGTLRLLATHSDRQPPQRCGPMVPSQKAFETIAFAKVSMSAHEAIDLGYLRKSDRIVLSRDHLIAEARQEVLDLAEDYVAPEPAVDGFRKAGTISDHDALIGKKLAWVLTGGERADGIRPLDEQYLLDLERETFVALAAEQKSPGAWRTCSKPENRCETEAEEGADPTQRTIPGTFVGMDAEIVLAFAAGGLLRLSQCGFPSPEWRFRSSDGGWNER